MKKKESIIISSVLSISLGPIDLCCRYEYPNIREQSKSGRVCRRTSNAHLLGV